MRIAAQPIYDAAVRLAECSGDFDQAAAQLDSLDATCWRGEAASAFQRRLDAEPEQWRKAGLAFAIASDALFTYAAAVERSENDREDLNQQRMAAASISDPAERKARLQIIEQSDSDINVALQRAGSVAAESIREATALAPEEASWWQGGLDFLDGLVVQPLADAWGAASWLARTLELDQSKDDEIAWNMFWYNTSGLVKSLYNDPWRTAVGMGRGFVHADDWDDDGARAAGGALFNIAGLVAGGVSAGRGVVRGLGRRGSSSSTVSTISVLNEPKQLLPSDVQPSGGIGKPPAGKSGYGYPHYASWPDRDFDMHKSGCRYVEGKPEFLHLTTERVTIKASGIAAVERHLRRFVDEGAELSEPMQGMLNRLRDIHAGRIKSSPVDFNFYTHELRESVRMRRQLGDADNYMKLSDEDRGHIWNHTHTAALEEYQLADADLLHSDVLDTPLDK